MNCSFTVKKYCTYCAVKCCYRVQMGSLLPLILLSSFCRVENYPDVQSLIRAAIKRHPIVSSTASKCGPVYSNRGVISPTLFKVYGCSVTIK